MQSRPSGIGDQCWWKILLHCTGCLGQGAGQIPPQQNPCRAERRRRRGFVIHDSDLIVSERNNGISVNNAGFVLGVERVGDISEDDIQAMYATNVFGLISVTQLFVKCA